MGLSLLLLVNAFFTVKNVHDSVASMCRQAATNISRIDIEILQNPSPYTPKMISMIENLTWSCGNERLGTSDIPRIIGQYVSTENLEGTIWQLRLGLMPHYYDEYDMIALTEGDVVLEDGSLSECVNILTRVSSGISCAVGINMSAGQSPSVPSFAHKFTVPTIKDWGFCLQGPANMGFVLFRSDDLRLFFDVLRQRFLVTDVAQGTSKYHFVSDTNLIHLGNILRRPQLRSKYHLMNHIGWQNGINMKNNEYIEYRRKDKNFRQIRTHLNGTKIFMCTATEYVANVRTSCLSFSEPCFFTHSFDCNDTRRKDYDFKFRYIVHSSSLICNSLTKKCIH